MASEPRRYALTRDRWIELGEMTGRDYLSCRDILSRRGNVTDADVETIIRILDARAVASSEDDPMDVEQSELIEVFFRWYMGVEDDAVPQPTGSSSDAPS